MSLNNTDEALKIKANTLSEDNLNKREMKKQEKSANGLQQL